jgi:4-carboxymuconolactone decarboxylase
VISTKLTRHVVAAARREPAVVILFVCTATIVFPQALSPQDSAGPAAALPKDVYPDSRFRLPLPKREQMDPYGQRVFDMLVDPARRSLVGLNGPAGIRLYDPKVAEMMNNANLYLRRDTGFGDRLSEIAILTTAREMDNQFEWSAHETAGRKAGVEPVVIDIIKYRSPITGLGEKETLIIRFGRELFGQNKVSSPTFAEALRLFGRRGVVDLSSLMAFYSATSALLNAFDMQSPEGQKPQLPVPAGAGRKE